MPASYVAGRYRIFRRHPIFLFYATAKFAFFLLVCAAFASFTAMYRDVIPDIVRYGLMFPVIFLLGNYAFFRLILAIVKYENKLMIIADDKLIIVNCTLILQDDIEVISLPQIMKFDVERHGFLPMFFRYGTLVIEQKKNDVRSFHFIPDPFEVLRILNEHVRKLESNRINMKREAIGSVVAEQREHAFTEAH
ncbi:MAG TPA: hypothetical protein PK765_01935 [bacterium]|nr:hypothetical protein [bacterium]